MSDHRRGGNLSSHVDVKLNQTTRKAQNIFVSDTLMILLEILHFYMNFYLKKSSQRFIKRSGRFPERTGEPDRSLLRPIKGRQLGTPLDTSS